MSRSQQWSQHTRLVAVGRPHAPGDPLNIGIHGVSAFSMGGERDYARADGTATWQALEDLVGAVEGGWALAFASGMGAIASVLATVPTGGRIAAPTDCYLGLGALLRDAESDGRWRISWLEPTATQDWVDAAANHDMLWLETPTNPMMKIMDLPAILDAANGQPCRTVVDSTFATPLGQRPLGMGADIVVHSATKYLGGHSDLLAGVAISADAPTAEEVRTKRTLFGATPGMLEAFLVTRGMRTLGLRMQAASANAAGLAERLAGHPGVTTVRYPGLPDDPGHETAKSFMDSFGAMVSFELAGGLEAAEGACAAVRLIRHATSLGGVESTMERRGALPGQEHVPASLIRLSVGCEDLEDLWADLDAALPR